MLEKTTQMSSEEVEQELRGVIKEVVSPLRKYDRWLEDEIFDALPLNTIITRETIREVFDSICY